MKIQQGKSGRQRDLKLEVFPGFLKLTDDKVKQRIYCSEDEQVELAYQLLGQFNIGQIERNPKIRQLARMILALEPRGADGK